MRGRGHRFKQFGRRNSYPRQVILDFLAGHPKQHFSAKEIYEHLVQENIYIGIASVYRNLEVLSELQFIKKYNFDKGEAKYQLNDASQRHHHIICPDRIIDFSLDQDIKTILQELQKKLEEKHQIQIKDYELKFFAEPKDK